MNRDEVTRRLAEFIDEIQPDRDDVEITPDASLQGELGLDSLSQIDLVSRVERAYRIIVPDQDLDEFVVVGDLADYVLARVGARQ